MTEVTSQAIFVKSRECCFKTEGACPTERAHPDAKIINYQALVDTLVNGGLGLVEALTLCGFTPEEMDVTNQLNGQSFSYQHCPSKANN